MMNIDSVTCRMTFFARSVAALAAIVTACGCLNQRVETYRAAERRIEAGGLTNLVEWFNRGSMDGTIPGLQAGEHGNCNFIDTNSLEPTITYPYSIDVVCEKQADTNVEYRYTVTKDNGTAGWRLQSAMKENKLTGEKVGLLHRPDHELVAPNEH